MQSDLAPMTSSTTASRWLSIGAPTLAAVLLAFAIVSPVGVPGWPMFGLITAALWWAWALWGWPRITVDDDIITVRNAMSTWHIPLQEVRHIEGGRALTLTLTDASRVTVAAMSGDGIATEAWRRTDAATEGGHFVRSADDARVSRQAQSAAADWAKQLRLRVDAAPERRDATVQRTPNTLIMLGSIGAVALAALAVTVFE